MSNKLKTRAVVVALKQIAERDNGLLKPKAVVDAARSKKSVLHRFFTWSNTRAAEQWRIHEARMLINVSVEYIGTEQNGQENRVFVSLKSDRAAHLGYRPLVQVLSDEGYRHQLLMDALESLAYWRQKYNNLKELSTVFEAIEAAQSKLRRTRKKAA